MYSIEFVRDTPYCIRIGVRYQEGGVLCHLTFGVGPIGIEVGKSSLVTDLLEGLWRFMIHLQDTAGPSPTASRVCIVRVEVDAPATRWLISRVYGRRALKNAWGRQLGGIEGVCLGGWSGAVRQR